MLKKKVLIHSVNSTGGHSIDCFNHKIANDVCFTHVQVGEKSCFFYSSFLLVTTTFNHICEIIEVESNH